MKNTDNKMKEIIQHIISAVNPTKVYLFGSRAKGTAREDSDFDFLVIYDGALSKRDVNLSLYRVFHRERIAVNLFILTSEEFKWQKEVATTLAREVDKSGVVAYG